MEQNSLMPSPAETIYKQFQDRGLQRIQEALSEADSESHFLDFKENSHQTGSGQTAIPTGKLSKEGINVLSKAASAFANTKGGVIVWGIEAKQNKSKVPKPIPEINQFVQQLYDQSDTILDPILAGIEHLAILSDSGKDDGYAVTYIPSGPNKPYQAIRGECRSYYQRAGSNSVPMDSDLVRALVIAKARPSLRLIVEPITRRDMSQYVGQIHLENTGPVLAEKCAIAIAKSNDQFQILGSRPQEARLKAEDDNSYWQADLYRLVEPTLYPGTSISVFQIVANQPDIKVKYAIFAEDFTYQDEFSIPQP